MNKVKRVIAVFPCMEKLTKVMLRGPLLEPTYHQITTMLYLDYVDYMGEASVVPQFAVSLADDRWGGYFSFDVHRTAETGRCECKGGGTGKRRNDCRDFGIWKGTPEEVENNPELTHWVGLRAAYLSDLEIKEADRKAIAKEKAKAKAKIYNERAKAKREIKQSQDRARQYAGLSELEEPPPPRFGNPDNVENHSVCGKPLARSLEELARFKATPVTWEFEGERWYCNCGETADAV